MQLLSERLANGTDFANVVELETHDFAAPTGWANISYTCGRDMTTLFFDSTRWKMSEGAALGAKGCMVKDDRAYVVQVFEHLTESLKVVVIGAHFPHRTLGTTLSASLRGVVNASGVESTLLIADTNINRPGAFPVCPRSLCSSSVEIFQGLDIVRADQAVSTVLEKTCCLNPPYGFAFEFDRIIANFGTSMTTELHDDPTPSWAVGAFHKSITGRLVVPSNSSMMSSHEGTRHGVVV